MMLFEVTQLGWKFASLRFGLNLVGILVLSALMDKTTKKEGEAIQETALKQLDES